MFYLRRFCRPTYRISDNKFCLFGHGDCLQRKMSIYFSYSLCLLLFSFIRCRKKVMQVLFCNLHSAVVLADNVWSSRQNYRPCVMVHQFCWPILSGNSTMPTKVGRLCHSSDIPLSQLWQPTTSIQRCHTMHNKTTPSQNTEPKTELTETKFWHYPMLLNTEFHI